MVNACEVDMSAKSKQTKQVRPRAVNVRVCQTKGGVEAHLGSGCLCERMRKVNKGVKWLLLENFTCSAPRELAKRIGHVHNDNATQET